MQMCTVMFTNTQMKFTAHVEMEITAFAVNPRLRNPDL